MIIGVHGKIGSGKETVAIFLAEELAKLNYYPEHKLFAFKIKQFIELLTGEKMVTKTDNEFIYGITDFTHEQKNKFIPEYGYTIGEMLQKIGTDLFRDRFHKETWIEAMFIDYKKRVDMNRYAQSLANDIGKYLTSSFSGEMDEYRRKEEERTNPTFPTWIIPDTRFPNEGERIISEGGFIISVVGDPKKENKKSSRNLVHESEIAMDDRDDLKKYIIHNNGTLEELKIKVRKIVKKEIL